MQGRFETFTVLINRISRNIRKIKKMKMAEYDLGSAHISCLYYLYAGEELTATNLCDRCEEDKATISRALEHLETQGYLAFPHQSAKRYNSLPVLTEKGRTVAAEITQKVDQVLDQLGNRLTEEERISFYRSLTVISDSLDAIAGMQEG